MKVRTPEELEKEGWYIFLSGKIPKGWRLENLATCPLGYKSIVTGSHINRTFKRGLIRDDDYIHWRA